MTLGENIAADTSEGRFGESLLAWYDRARRDLPWRAPPGVTPDPYRVWLSEIMLQQTTVKAVAPYYAKFLKQWPTVHALAAADLEDILSAWAGLGYYARARNLYACAKVVTDKHGGRFPRTESELLNLPGIGPYTAAAIGAIAFDQRAAAVDGNVERVLARCYAVETPLPAAKKLLREYAREVTPSRRPGDFAQAMMDLGAIVCTPRAPSCAICPLEEGCAARARGLEAQLPSKSPKPEKPTRRGAAFFVERADGAVLLRKRPARGLLGGMTEVPGSPWMDAGNDDEADPLIHAPVEGSWETVPGLVQHTFTHFYLELSVYRANVGRGTRLSEGARPDDCRWVPKVQLSAQALPSVMRKVVTHALEKQSG